MPIELYGFQSELCDKLSIQDGKPVVSRLLSDDMGLGKTLEASTIDKKLRDHVGRPRSHKTLVIAPHGTHQSWKRHIELVMPGAKVVVIDRKDRAPFVRCLKNSTYTHYVMHYEALRLIPELRDVAWFHIIADEVHRIKNRKDMALDELILTPDGWTEMGQIRVGDLVIGSSGQPTKVVGVYPQGQQDVYEVVLTDGARVEVGPHHLWTVRNSRGNWKTITTLEIQSRLSYDGGHYGRFTYLPRVAPVRFNTANDFPIEPYALGLLLGDGGFTTYGTYSNGMISFTSADGLESALPWELKPTQRGKGNCTTYDLLGAREPVRRLGLLGKKSHEKYIPPAYLLGSPIERQDLLCGLMDTDGWVQVANRGRGSFGSTSLQLTQGVRELVLSLGGTTSRIRTDKTLRKGATKLFYQLEVYLPEGVCPFRLKRKADLWQPAKKLTRSVSRVAYSRRTQTQCIEVEAEDGLYVTRDYVLTHNSQQTRKMKELRTQFKTGCSGTPADNAPQDLWSILNWLYPRIYRSYWSFVKRFCLEEVTENKFGGTFRKIVGTNPITIGQLHEEMAPWYMRRLKKDVLSDLPEKYYTERFVDLLPAQRKVYNQMRKSMIAWIGEHEDTPLVASVVVAQLVRLQQIALATPEWYLWKTDPESGEQINRIKLTEPSSKLDDLQEIIDDNPTEQFVVFTQSRSMVNLVAARFGSKSRRVGRYSGDVSAANRNLVVEGFQRGDIQIFAGTIAAGGEGIELTAASTGVFLDRHWSPAKNNQAEDRLHRIGQPNAVQIIDIMARDTIDLGRKAVIASKWENLKLLLGDHVDPNAYRLGVEMVNTQNMSYKVLFESGA